VILVRFTYKLDKAADTTVCGDTSQGGEDYGYENDLTSDSTCFWYCFGPEQGRCGPVYMRFAIQKVGVWPVREGGE